MSTYRAILRQIERGQSVETVREELGLRADVIDAMIQSMRREGHLADFGCVDETCPACPMSGSCPMASVGGPTSYLVTERGSQFVADGQQASD